MRSRRRSFTQYQVNAKPVIELVKRVNISFSFLVIIGLFIVFFGVYKPLVAELKGTIIEKFNWISLLSYNSFEHVIESNIDGAKSLASRTMIKSAVYDYAEKKISLEELIEYTQPRYLDGTSVFNNLIYADRTANDQIIAYHKLDESFDIACYSTHELYNLEAIEYSFCLRGENKFLLIFSPVIYEEGIIVYDRLIFDLKEQTGFLNEGVHEVILLNKEDYEVILKEGDLIIEDNLSKTFFYNSHYCQIFFLKENAYFLSQQSDESLMSSVKSIGNRTGILSIVLLVIYIGVIYIYLIRFASKKLNVAEKEKIELKEVADRANVDALTKAGSRRYGVTCLRDAFTAFHRDGHASLIYLFDVDNLKSINDVFGHNAGDLVLQAIAESVNSGLGPKDRLFRWGGDEFVILDKSTKIEEAIEKGSEIIQKIKDIKIEIESEIISSSVSIGISSFEDFDKDYTDVLARADKAMYLSKTQGKGRANIQ